MRPRIAVLSTIVAGALWLAPATAGGHDRTFRVTFYCRECDPASRTATGRPMALPGVAVDPTVIPLGSRVKVPGFGWLVADDTGRAIKGRRLDVRLSSRGACGRFGVKRLAVTIRKPKKGRRR